MLQAVRGKSNEIIAVERKGNSLYLDSERGHLRLTMKNSRTVRVTYTQRELFSEKGKPGVINEETYPDWEYALQGETVMVRTECLQIFADLKSGKLRYCDSVGKLLLQENGRELEEFVSCRLQENGQMKTEQVETPDGIKKVIREATRITDEQLYHSRLYLEWQEGEALYGLGQHEEGLLNLRGQMVYGHQANMKIAIPVLVSSLGYGILMDTYSPFIFSDTVYGSYLYAEADDEMDYYFMWGGSMDGVIKEYRLLTGKAAMLPKWAYGYVQSQERYETQEEILKVVQEYRDRGIGLDCIVLDWNSWEEGLWGQKTFDPKRFPDPAGMIKQLHEENVRFMISIWANPSANCEDYKAFHEKGWLLPGDNIYNPMLPEARELYWKQAKEGLFDYGVDAWWCDASEPYSPEWNHNKRVEPAVMYEEYHKTSGDHLPARLTNAFCLYHAMTIYEGQRREAGSGNEPEKRVVNLTRSGYTGQQRLGTILWSGDTKASWDTLRRQIAAGLNFCASGLPYWTTDIGAFFVKDGGIWFWNGDFEDANQDMGYRELFVRWYQWGSMLPIFRGHGTDCRRELWKFGHEGEPFYDALIQANRLRYEWIPYIYSLAGAVWREDASMLRLLAFDFPRDKNVLEIKDQYMFGKNVMVCPVTKPMYYEKGSLALVNTEKTREVYLPEGCCWYDYWTNVRYEGGQWIDAKAPIERIPLFIREGSILPTTAFAPSVAELSAEITLKVYSGRDGSFRLYEDRGDGYGYETGEYSVTELSWLEQKQKLMVSNREEGLAGRMKVEIIR